MENYKIIKIIDKIILIENENYNQFKIKVKDFKLNDVKKFKKKYRNYFELLKIYKIKTTNLNNLYQKKYMMENIKNNIYLNLNINDIRKKLTFLLYSFNRKYIKIENIDINKFIDNMVNLIIKLKILENKTKYISNKLNNLIIEDIKKIDKDINKLSLELQIESQKLDKLKYEYEKERDILANKEIYLQNKILESNEIIKKNRKIKSYILFLDRFIQKEKKLEWDEFIYNIFVDDVDSLFNILSLLKIIVQNKNKNIKINKIYIYKIISILSTYFIDSDFYLDNINELEEKIYIKK